jgi:hypothetical protein
VFAIDNASIANATSMNLTIANLADLAGNVMVPASWSYTITPPPLEHYGEVVYTVFDAGTSSRTETEIEVVTETGKTRVKNSTSFQYDPNFPNALILSTCGLYKLARADGLVWATCVAQKDHLRHCFLLHPAKQELKDADSGVCPAYPATQAESTNWVLAVDVPKATTSKGEFFAPLNLNVARIDFRANDGTTKTVFNGTFAADGRVAFLVSFPAF